MEDVAHYRSRGAVLRSAFESRTTAQELEDHNDGVGGYEITQPENAVCCTTACAISACMGRRETASEPIFTNTLK
ncbi:hypothetical protein EVAR_3597_1 [Eumeta japonica]|uniref:Uncharacterized protein n=1 Tax=Eumeta variegata TaxID=151549 RepID=A0A4C1SWD5_EUMVA|nr:hypothetical protein EVAR_3597_1 [Eumeta japonica]